MAELGARSWAERWGLVGDAAQARRLAGMGHGRMAGFVAPSASSAELELLACWGAFITLVDDGFDRGGEYAPVSEVRAVLDPLVEVLKGTGTGAAVRTPAVAALEDLWRRTVVGTAPGWCARFAASYAFFAEATCEEARWREERYMPSVQEYIGVRRRTITVAPLLLVSERLLDAWPQAEAFHDVCADVVAWTNDLFDAGAEQAGEVGLVDALVRERGVGRGEAAAITRAMVEERLDDFEPAAGRLADSNPHAGDVRSRIDRVRTFLYGAVAWQYESRRYRATLPVQRAPGELAEDPVESAAVRLERRLALAVAPDGALPDRCAGRVLETTLLLALLRAHRTHPEEQRELTCWLGERRAGADPLDALLIDAVLRPQVLPADAADAAAPFADHLVSSTGGRGRLKRSMLHAVLHVLGGLGLNAEDIPPVAFAGALSTFTLANLLAVRIVYAQATDHPHAVSSSERFQLADVLEDGSGRLLWEASAATHLLALNALQSCRPGHPVVGRAVTGLLLARDSGGGMPFLDSQDVWLSAVGGLAFLSRPALRPYAVRMGTFVASWQAPDGGWPFASGIRQTDVDTAARCMEFLHALDPHRYRAHLTRGAAYLAAKAGPEGGLPTWREGDDPDLDMTAGAVLALAPHAAYVRHVTAATRFILDTQRPDGTWDRSWTLSESSVILRAVDALDAASHTSDFNPTRAAAAVARAVARLTATQKPDGSWGRTPDHASDTLSTAQAIPVLARYGPPHVTAAATAHLISRQDDTGRFPAPPDQTGPRPLPFDYPVVADLHALATLTRIQQPRPARSESGAGGTPPPKEQAHAYRFVTAKELE
ncbi:prenyltransferase/squalene oxidase repeat-containing protein [Streptomyces sp. NBC_00057]|uniref:terpene synthase family protein n=1 Tax=Streptomyces sp. NBC_00057 TaxID=2975634 RepID=UPI00324A9D70